MGYRHDNKMIDCGMYKLGWMQRVFGFVLP